ncbi:antileukoproteinase-like [Rattus rattus]|uniref:antileukoproteinase-like n=1 Tax=Rattus rattus TaxID=10117 RepID=UPI0013F32EF6|nr:antileukoproteinase-like [Rattus rattus]
MKSSGLFPLTVLLALGVLAPWSVEGGKNDTIKVGAYPARKPAPCLQHEKPQCGTDQECPKKQRCCQDNCDVKWVNPIRIRGPVKKKPGYCPRFAGKCPKSRCTMDTDCLGELKCCKLNCGKVCLPPV